MNLRNCSSFKLVVWKRISSNDAWRRKNLSKKDSKVLEYMGYAAKGRRNQSYMQLVLNKPYCIFCTTSLPISEFNLLFFGFLYTVHSGIPHPGILWLILANPFSFVISAPGLSWTKISVFQDFIFIHLYIIIIHIIMYNIHQTLLFTAFLAF